MLWLGLGCMAALELHLLLVKDVGSDGVGHAHMLLELLLVEEALLMEFAGGDGGEQRRWGQVCCLHAGLEPMSLLLCLHLGAKFA